MDEGSRGSRQFVSFYVNGRLFGFDIRLIKEVTPSAPITPVPLKKRDVSGVLNIRGQVVVVLDVSLSLGGPEQSITEDSQILIMKNILEIQAVSDFVPANDGQAIGAIPVGFLVESVGELVTVEKDAIEEAPGHLQAQYRNLVEGVVRHEEMPLVILDAVAILGAQP